MRFILSILVLSIISLLTSGCESNLSREHLLSRVNQYYLHEKNKNWEKTYIFRTRKFREFTKYNQYFEEMEKESLGWKLEEVVVKNIVLEGNKAQVVLVFKEIPPAGYFEKLGLPREQAKNLIRVNTESWGIWIFENGDWYCQDVDARSHL